MLDKTVSKRQLVLCLQPVYTLAKHGCTHYVPSQVLENKHWSLPLSDLQLRGRMRLALRRNGVEGGLNWVVGWVGVCRERVLEVDRVCFVEVFW